MSNAVRLSLSRGLSLGGGLFGWHRNLFRLYAAAAVAAAAAAVTLMQKCGKFIGAPLR